MDAFENLEFVRDAYQVFLTVGFRYSHMGDAGVIQSFVARLEIVRYAGAEQYSPLMWEIDPDRNCLCPVDYQFPIKLDAATPEDALSRCLEFLDSRGARPL